MAAKDGEPAVEVTALRCQSCGAVALSSGWACQSCGGCEFEEVSLGTKGRLYASTIIRVAPTRFQGTAPYRVVVAEFAEGVLVVGRLDSSGQADLPIGSELTVASRDEVGYHFVPVDGHTPR